MSNCCQYLAFFTLLSWVHFIFGVSPKIWLLWHYRLWSLKSRDTKLERFSIKINIPKGNYWILRIGLTGSLSSLQKSEFSQNSIFSFGYVDFYAKIFLILHPWTWISITRNAILLIIQTRSECQFHSRHKDILNKTEKRPETRKIYNYWHTFFNNSLAVTKMDLISLVKI